MVVSTKVWSWIHGEYQYTPDIKGWKIVVSTDDLSWINVEFRVNTNFSVQSDINGLIK